MGWAIITLTKKGLQLASKIRKSMPEVDIYTMPKYLEDGSMPIVGSLKDFNACLFKQYTTLIYIMATGIVVRGIYPYLKHKSVDPAILVIDNNGKFVISLLSGHLGGANDRAKLIARVIDAQPVITTSSDNNGQIAVDMLAKRNNLIIENYIKAKDITALIVNNYEVGILSEGDFIKETFTNNVRMIESVEENVDGIIYISNSNIKIMDKPFVQLIPQNIIIGVGCKQGIETKNLIKFILEELQLLNISTKALKKITSIEIKDKEECIIEASKYFNVEFVTYKVNQIKEVEDLFKGSDFVRDNIGVSSVCEPSGYLGSNKGKCLLRKKVKSGMTLSIWEENSTIDKI